MEGAYLVFLSTINSADYHNVVNSEHYLEWMTTQLLPSLQEPSVIVLDNVRYYNKQRDKAHTSSDGKRINLEVARQTQQYKETDMKKTLLNITTFITTLTITSLWYRQRNSQGRISNVTASHCPLCA